MSRLPHFEQAARHPALLHQLLQARPALDAGSRLCPNGNLDVAGAPVVRRRSIRGRQFDEAGQRVVKQHQRQGSGKHAEGGGNGVGATAQPIQTAAEETAAGAEDDCCFTRFARDKIDDPSRDWAEGEPREDDQQRASPQQRVTPASSAVVVVVTRRAPAIRRFISRNSASAVSPRWRCSSGAMSGTSLRHVLGFCAVTIADLRGPASLAGAGPFPGVIAGTSSATTPQTLLWRSGGVMMDHEPAPILLLKDVRAQVGATDYRAGHVFPLRLLNPGCPGDGSHDLYARFHRGF